jgi:hypothetical protein
MYLNIWAKKRVTNKQLKRIYTKEEKGQKICQNQILGQACLILRKPKE